MESEEAVSSSVVPSVVTSAATAAAAVKVNVQHVKEHVKKKSTQAAQKVMLLQMSSLYDPLSSPDWDAAGTPGTLCAGRVKRDLSSIFKEPLPGIFVVPDEENWFKVHCLVVGPFDTPYEGGFFHFLVRFGPQYPLHPPRVRLITTGNNTVRFNPNLYSSGKVCLSILGTWTGPSWSPASNLGSVLLSIQSLMNEKPYHNEPGYETERTKGDCERYNSIIGHETIRVAVLSQLEGNTTAPRELCKLMQASFLDYYDHYVEVCQKGLLQDGKDMMDPFGERRGKYRFASLMTGLEQMKTKIVAMGPIEIDIPTPTCASSSEPGGDGSATNHDDFNICSLSSMSDESDEEAENDEG